MPTKHSMYDSDTHYVIEPDTKRIKNESQKTILTQGDHNSEIITFEIPRYIDGHDMSLCDRILIHYINSETNGSRSNSDSYEVNDVKVDEDNDNVIFSWVISGNATMYPGTLTFLIQFTCFDQDNPSEKEYVWNTSKFESIDVLPGMDNGEPVVTRYSDVLEQWKIELNQIVESISGMETAIDESGVLLE